MTKRACIVKLGHYPDLMLLIRDSETLVSHGYSVDIICVRKKGQKARETTASGVNIYRLPGDHRRQGALRYIFEYGYFFVLTSLILAWRSVRRRYDVIEVCSMPDFLVFSTIIPRLSGTKVILNLWENMPALFMSTFHKGQKHIFTILLHLAERVSTQYAHHIIVADGIPYKQALEGHGVPSEKITAILNVPDNVTFNLESMPTVKDNDHFILIVVATHTKRYGVQTVIKAIPRLIEHIPKLMVNVTGDGEYRPELNKLAGELGVAEYLNFTGRIPYENYLANIAKAHVGIAPMLYDVGVSNKVFEYFALGTPVVASALPSLMSTFSSNCILYYTPGNEEELADRVIELYHNPGKRTSLAASGQAFYQKCRWQVMKHEYLKVYTNYTKSNGDLENIRDRSMENDNHIY
jgi:glycosyltransferase involved in cell wall biosynthesis